MQPVLVSWPVNDHLKTTVWNQLKKKKNELWRKTYIKIYPNRICIVGGGGGVLRIMGSVFI